MHHSRRSRPYNSVVRRLRTVGPQKSSIAPRPKAISKAPFTLTFARQPKALGFTREEDLQASVMPNWWRAICRVLWMAQQMFRALQSSFACRTSRTQGPQGLRGHEKSGSGTRSEGVRAHAADARRAAPKSAPRSLRSLVRGEVTKALSFARWLPECALPPPFHQPHLSQNLAPFAPWCW